MREIVIDTETTGLDPLNGDRIVEIGAVELILSDVSLLPMPATRMIATRVGRLWKRSALRRFGLDYFTIKSLAA